MNKVIIMGRICRDPETETVGKGKNALSKLWNCIAVNKNAAHTDFINFTAFGKTAEIIEEYCKKGDPLLIEGHIDVNTVEDKKGNMTSYTSIIADRIELIGGKKDA